LSEFIYHATFRTAWLTGQKSGAYTADSLAEGGFIHCSKADQLTRTVNTYFAGQGGLVVLVIDPQKLTAEMRWEPGTDLPSVLFPHVYGPINLAAVVRVVDLVPGVDGKFSLPESL
jgi:uncharacterized protein (DUF952 family)